MKTVINNEMVSYYDYGNPKKGVILELHGWLDSSQTFSSLNHRLEDEYRIISIDFPGFGGSTKNHKINNLEDCVNFISEFLEKIKAKPDYYLGHSFGGRILLKGLGEQKLKAEKVVLLSSAGISSQRSFKVMLLNRLSKFFKYLLPIKFKTKIYSLLGSDYLESKHLESLYKNILEEDLQIYCSKIHMPVLLIYGNNDKSTPVEYGKKFHLLLKNSRLEVLDGDHFIHKKNPENISELIKNFLI